MTDSEDKAAIAFKGYLDVSTYMRMDKHLNPEKMVSLSGLVALVVLIPFILHVFKGTFSSTVGILIGFGICIVVGGIVAGSYLIGLRMKHTHRRKLYQLAISKEPRTGTVDAAGIHIQIAAGRTDLEWNYFTSALSSENGIGLCKDKQIVDGFGSSMFASESEWHRARCLIEEKMKGVPNQQIHPIAGKPGSG
jgi:hypothetical protein